MIWHAKYCLRFDLKVWHLWHLPLPLFFWRLLLFWIKIINEAYLVHHQSWWYFSIWQEKQFYCAGTLIEPQIDQRKLLKWWIWLHWQDEIDLCTTYVSLTKYKTSFYYYVLREKKWYLLDFLNELFRFCILIFMHILTKPTTIERRFIFMEVLFGLIGVYVAGIVSWSSSEVSTI